MSDAPTKKCSKCGIVKTRAEFTRVATGSFGLASSCKPCEAERSALWRKNNPEKMIGIRARMNASRRTPEWRAHAREYEKSPRQAKRRAEYASRTENLAKQVKRVQKSKGKHPEREAARNAVTLAVRHGTMIKPSTCECCGRGGRIEAHHVAGHLEACWLIVSWLCPPCHKEADRIAKESLNMFLALAPA